MKEENIINEVTELIDDINKSYNEARSKIDDINKETLFALGEEYGFKKYIIKEDGKPMFFTFKMFTTLGMYEKLMNDYNINSIRELREKLDKLNEYEHRDRV